ncbi:phage tail protein I [Aminobacterium sp. MB27-C1]|uniref:phage tail protein I n=1 Tax=Aminobacterium sp. MB27-C1 TaxID=3070661 RepID=UPI0027DD3099|nr:phage tail protein I [Aminobacterium sp. MB27-C1]WMI72140.1 phage tail protein I [Aminobacterium sp. MB27-C1]
MASAGLKDLIPASIAIDSQVKSATLALDDQLADINSHLIQTIILPRVDELSQEVLDLLLWEFHITLDEGAGLAVSVEEKRDLVKRAVEIHRLKGTKAALLRIFEMLSMRGVISEWYEYGGEPYKFKVEILELSERGLDEQTYVLLERLIDEYKNVRSWLDELNVYLTVRGAVPKVAMVSLCGEEITVYPYNVTELENVASIRWALGYQAVETVTVYPL